METDIIYLDNAATTFPKPPEMHRQMGEFYRTCGVNPGRTGCDLALKAEEMINETRKILSNMFKKSIVDSGTAIDHNRMVFTQNATHSLNQVIRGVLSPGDHVVTTMVEHNSVIRPVNHMVELGCEATYVKPDAEGYVDPEDIRKAIKSNTKLVVVNHGSNVIGTVQDIKTIGAICKDAGVQFAVDCAQTAGVMDIDMGECNIQFLTFTGHKALFGPTGTGGICVAEEARIKSSQWGGTGVRSAEPLHLEEFPYRLEAGTLNLAGIAGLNAGVNWVIKEGPENIHHREIELLAMLQDGLADIKGVTIHGTTKLENRVPTVCITVAGYDPSDVGTILDVEYNVLTRTGLHCAPLIHEHMGTTPRGTVRFSVGPFNVAEHIETAIKAVAEISADRN